MHVVQKLIFLKFEKLLIKRFIIVISDSDAKVYFIK